MRIAAVSVCLLVAAFASPAFGQSFLGEWTATAVPPDGNGVSETVTAVKTTDGVAITAKLVNPVPGAPEAGPGTDIVLDGDKFSYKRSIGELVITYTGVVSGDTFTGTVDIGGFALPYTGVRIKKGS
jgi:hypothetical protein